MAVEIYTDGSCIGNPGPGGYGVVVLNDGRRQEFSGGFGWTTNNRMEILAAIVGLESLRALSTVTVYSDSQYLVRAIEKGWAKRWQKNRWMRNKSERALNPDLWQRLLDLTRRHKVRFQWVKGHAGNVENERCDLLANQAAGGRGLPPDKGYKRN